MPRKNIYIRPGKGQSMAGFVVGVIFVLIGLCVVVPTFGPFGLLWTGIAVVITVTHARNAFGKNGVPSMEIYTEEDGESCAAPDVKERLRQLEDLKASGLITEEEYQDKRAEILREL